MKTYTGKTVEEALQNAASETGIEIDDLIYIVSDKKKGLFSKKIVVEVESLSCSVLNQPSSLTIQDRLHCILTKTPEPYPLLSADRLRTPL